jgi:hypothetical protein
VGGGVFARTPGPQSFYLHSRRPAIKTNIGCDLFVNCGVLFQANKRGMQESRGYVFPFFPMFPAC